MGSVWVMSGKIVRRHGTKLTGIVKSLAYNGITLTQYRYQWCMKHSHALGEISLI